jgi:glycosyltransferase involved in cell wall biosynthesis
MTRIAIDLRMYRHSGIGRYLRNLLPPLLPLLQAESIRVIAPPALIAGAPWLHDPHIEVFPTDAAIYSIAEQLLSLRGAFRDTQLLWVPHYNAPIFYRGPLAVTIHDIAPLALPEILGNPIKRAYARLLIERATTRATAILSASEFTSRELQTRLAVDPRKINVAYQGLEATWPSSAKPHREPDGAPYLLYVGNVKPNKNLGRLLEAFAIIQHRIPHRLILAGKMRGFGTNDDAVLQCAANMGDRVRFTGEIPDSGLIALYAGATALVMPSLYEGFGLPLLEAMHLGCPVLSSNAAALPEVAAAAALYFDPRNTQSIADCLLRVTDAPLLESLRTTGRLRAAQFSYATCAAQTAAVLNPLLTPSPRSR